MSYIEYICKNIYNDRSEKNGGKQVDFNQIANFIIMLLTFIVFLLMNGLVSSHFSQKNEQYTRDIMMLFLSLLTITCILFLDTFKTYKEVLYDSFKKHLPANVVIDLNFHHYNPKCHV